MLTGTAAARDALAGGYGAGGLGVALAHGLADVGLGCRPSSRTSRRRLTRRSTRPSRTVRQQLVCATGEQHAEGGIGDQVSHDESSSVALGASE